MLNFIVIIFTIARDDVPDSSISAIIDQVA
jgi:hypothetical protein